MHYHLQITSVFINLQLHRKGRRKQYYTLLQKQNTLFSLDSRCFIPSVEHTVNANCTCRGATELQVEWDLELAFAEEGNTEGQEMLVG